MTDQLKPCPFCGSEKVELESEGDGNNWVECQFCATCGPMQETEADAIAAWNAAARLTPVERAVLDAAVAWREAGYKCVLGGPPEPYMVFLNKETVMREASDALARERRGGE